LIAGGNLPCGKVALYLRDVISKMPGSKLSDSIPGFASGMVQEDFSRPHGNAEKRLVHRLQKIQVQPSAFQLTSRNASVTDGWDGSLSRPRVVLSGTVASARRPYPSSGRRH
jgi:hypothetical protein